LLIYAVATLAFVCECLLQRAAGVSWGAVGASVCVLTLAAAATVTLMRQTSGLVEHLAGAQRESQALADLLGSQLKASQIALSEAAAPAAPEVNAPAAPEASAADASGLSILIVEDEVHLLSALERTFGARHRITTAGSGNEALAVFEKGRALRRDLERPRDARRDRHGVARAADGPGAGPGGSHALLERRRAGRERALVRGRHGGSGAEEGRAAGAGGGQLPPHRRGAGPPPVDDR
jgi:hypothetical protein